MIIDGKFQAKLIREKIKKEILELKNKYKKTPALSVILIGNYAPSMIYVKSKKKQALEVGIESEVIKFDDNVSENLIIKKIEQLNKDEKTSGILVQLPLPTQINKQKLINTINPNKDVDGFNPINVGSLASGYEAVIPCTPLGCLYLIKSVEKDLNGKHAVILGRSNLNGKPMAQLLLKENCTVTILHSKTKDLKKECKKADILVAAVGVKEIVKEDWVNEGAIVIDVGINKVNGKIVGDVCFEKIKNKVKAITPVPGGVGPMTVACLLENTVNASKNQILLNNYI